MSVQRLRWSALVAALLVLVIGFWASSHHVVVYLNGQTIELETTKLTVGGALAELGVSLEDQDELDPGSMAILREDMEVRLDRAIQYQIWVDGSVIEHRSGQRDPLLVLADVDIDLDDNDRLRVHGKMHDLANPFPFELNLNIEIERAAEILVRIDGEEMSILSSAQSIVELLSENGIVLFEGDDIQPGLETKLSSANLIRITRANNIDIRIGEEIISVRSIADTVGEVLASAGIALQGLDRSIPNADEAIPESGLIEVIRVQERVEMNTNVIPFSTEWQGDPNTEIDERSVIQPGQNGIRATSQRVLYENGTEISRVNEGEWVLSEPVTQISGFGTNVVVRTAIVDGVTIEYWRTLTLFATSYSPCRSGVEACLYYTALGDEVKKGIAAVYLSWWYAMGQHTVFVPGYGPAKISDNGAYPDGRPWIDLGYSDEDWVSWGDWVTVYFTTPIPPEHEILYLLPPR